MRVIGVELTRPSGADVLISVGLATATLVAITLANRLFDLALPRDTAFMFFCVALWGSLSRHMGIRLRTDWRHALLLTAGTVTVAVTVVLVLGWTR